MCRPFTKPAYLTLEVGTLIVPTVWTRGQWAGEASDCLRSEGWLVAEPGFKLPQHPAASVLFDSFHFKNLKIRTSELLTYLLHILLSFFPSI